jgi:coenzyme Q-binding protein COQ10
VEAVSGNGVDVNMTDNSIDRKLVRGQHARGRRPGTGSAAPNGGLFESLMTRWVIKPVHGASKEEDSSATEVALIVRFQFANPAYGLAVGQVADEMAGLMVEAFEKRARELYGR